MNRVPAPLSAARLIREYLETHTEVRIAYRQALDLVAIAEGYPNWQTRQAAQETAVAPEPTSQAHLRQSEYLQVWNKLAESCRAAMASMENSLDKSCPMSVGRFVEDTDGEEFAFSITLSTTIPMTPVFDARLVLKNFGDEEFPVHPGGLRAKTVLADSYGLMLEVTDLRDDSTLMTRSAGGLSQGTFTRDLKELKNALSELPFDAAVCAINEAAFLLK